MTNYISLHIIGQLTMCTKFTCTIPTNVSPAPLKAATLNKKLSMQTVNPAFLVHTCKSRCSTLCISCTYVTWRRVSSSTLRWAIELRPNTRTVSCLFLLNGFLASTTNSWARKTLYWMMTESHVVEMIVSTKQNHINGKSSSCIACMH